MGTDEAGPQNPCIKLAKGALQALGQSEFSRAAIRKSSSSSRNEPARAEPSAEDSIGFKPSRARSSADQKSASGHRSSHLPQNPFGATVQPSPSALRPVKKLHPSNPSNLFSRPQRALRQTQSAHRNRHGDNLGKFSTRASRLAGDQLPRGPQKLCNQPQKSTAGRGSCRVAEGLREPRLHHADLAEGIRRRWAFKRRARHPA